jgi:hypothetical protein
MIKLQFKKTLKYSVIRYKVIGESLEEIKNKLNTFKEIQISKAEQQSIIDELLKYQFEDIKFIL